MTLKTIGSFVLGAFLISNPASSAEVHEGPLKVSLPQSFVLFNEAQLRQRKSYLLARKQIAQAKSDIKNVRKTACLALKQLDAAIDRSIYLDQSNGNRTRGGENGSRCPD